MKKASVLICLLVSISLVVSCSKKGGETSSPQKGDISLTFTSHKSGDVVQKPLPVTMKGTVKNYDSLSAEQKKNMHLYLVEQSTMEKIWHIEPEATVDAQGNWTGKTWLGKWREKNDDNFHVCIVALDKKLKLRNGNHPVDKKPSGLAETCIDMTRDMKR